MRGSKAALFTSERSDWETPRALFDRLHAVFDFGLDAAASSKNARVPGFISEGALQPDLAWSVVALGRNIWLNPPYGRGLADWTTKAAVEGYRTTVVALLPARTDTAAFDVLFREASSILFFNRRLVFELDGEPILDKKGRPMSAPFPSALAVFSPRSWEREMQSLRDLGHVISRSVA